MMTAKFATIAWGALFMGTISSITLATGQPAATVSQPEIQLVEAAETAAITSPLFKDKSCATLITPRGSFGLSLNPADHTSVVFEWEGKGYAVTTTIVAAKNGFVYFKMQDVDFAMAVRETPVCGVYQVYFYAGNNLTTPLYFSEGLLYLVN